METAVVNQTTIYPICMYDEGLGAPSAYEAHPENAAFVEAAEPNCFPDSKVDVVLAQLQFSMTKGALVTDALDAIKVGYMPIMTSFINDYTAIDELSSTEVQDVLELQTEATDRQGFPLYNAVDMPDKFGTTVANLPTNVPGLDTGQSIEGVAFNHEEFYDALHFMTIAEKLKVCQRGLKWMILTRDHPVKKVNLRLARKNKFMNPFNFFGVLVTVPAVDTRFQIPIAASTTNINHVDVEVHYRYNEWNQDFNMRKI